MNPKDEQARRENKPNLALIPPEAEVECAKAMMFGAAKYEPWNWRKVDSGVDMTVYIAAAKRHLNAMMRGEDRASDSGVTHAGHVMACMAIILDAQANGCLLDDRPSAGGPEPGDEPNEKLKEAAKLHWDTVGALTPEAIEEATRLVWRNRDFIHDPWRLPWCDCPSCIQERQIPEWPPKAKA